MLLGPEKDVWRQKNKWMFKLVLWEGKSYSTKASEGHAFCAILVVVCSAAFAGTECWPPSHVSHGSALALSKSVILCDACNWEHLLLSWARVLILEEMEPAESFRSPTWMEKVNYVQIDTPRVPIRIIFIIWYIFLSRIIYKMCIVNILLALVC